MILTKEQKVIFDQLKIGTENETVTNLYSNISVELNPEAVAVFDLVMGVERSAADDLFLDADRDELYNLMQTGRDIFIENWPKEYMILLD